MFKLEDGTKVSKKEFDSRKLKFVQFQSQHRNSIAFIARWDYDNFIVITSNNKYLRLYCYPLEPTEYWKPSSFFMNKWDGRNYINDILKNCKLPKKIYPPGYDGLYNKQSAMHTATNLYWRQ